MVFRSGWNYGITDKTGVLDIKLLVDWQNEDNRLDKGIVIIVNGREEYKSIEGDVKASLATKPFKYLFKDYQVYLSIGYDLKQERLTLSINGTDVEKLPRAKEDQLIY